ncbi:GPI17 [Candida margitis]|uniref:GPI17 n=1 Tax=Candida margitis TaxID=1775924 RepID=UPI00222751E4|nr:GPI17 [Candida margitis]KAI5969749.1 GPI17 [Candida margitis]
MRESKESPNITSIRKVITLAVIILMAGIGYPLFTYTTSIYRAELPVDQINSYDLSSMEFKIPVHVNTVIDGNGLRSKFKSLYPDLAQNWVVELVDNVHAKYTVNVHQNAKEFSVETNDKTIDVSLRPQDDVNASVQQALFAHVFKDELDMFVALKHRRSTSDISFAYNGKYSLVFSLLVEDGKKINWQIKEALEEFEPVLAYLQNITSFTITTQIQYYSNLKGLYPDGVVTQDDLTTFVDFGGWNLVNLDINPTINFVTFLPIQPLSIADSEANSFLISQWGGFKIYNRGLPSMTNATLTADELIPIMNTFANQLLQLLGFPNGNQSLTIKLDSLERLLVYQNVQSSIDNLKSLVKLSQSLNEITVPEETRQQVLYSLEKVDEALKTKSVEAAAQAESASNKAFFEKEMVQQAYFPSEHKLAVFLPLLGPIASIVIFNTVKLIKGN